MRVPIYILPLIFSVTQQTASAQELAARFKDYRLDVRIPTIPALTALELQPSAISQPGTPRELAMTLSNGWTPRASGVLQSDRLDFGLAIEVAPFKLENARFTPVNTHNPSWLIPLQISIASNITASTYDTAMQMAIGARYTALHYEPANDPLLKTCLLSQFDEPPLPLAKCRAMARAASLASRGLELAATGVLATDSIRISDLEPSKISVWTSYSWGMNSFAQILPALTNDEDVNRDEYRSFISTASERNSPEATALANAYGLSMTGHLRYDAWRTSGAVQNGLYLAMRGSYLRDGFGVFLETGVRGTGSKYNWPKSFEVPIGLGGDIHLSNGTWLNLSLGVNTSSGDGLLMSNFTWTLAEEE